LKSGYTYANQISLLRTLLSLVLIFGALIPLNATQEGAQGGGTPLRSVEYLELSEAMQGQDLDSALTLGQRAMETLTASDSVGVKTRVLNNLGDIYLTKADFDMALDFFLQAKKNNEILMESDPENQSLWLVEAGIHVRIGILHFRLHDYESSLIDYQEALKLLESADPNIAEFKIARRKMILFNNFAGIYLQESAFDSALSYFQKAQEMNLAEKDESFEGSITNNIGLCHLEMGDHDLADLYFHLSLVNRTKRGDVRGQAQCLNNLGKNQIKLGKLDEARGYFEQSLALSKANGGGESTLISLESLASVNESLGDYKSAFEAHKAFKALNDSIFSTESQVRMALLEASYTKEREERIAEVEKERFQAQQQKKELYTLIIGGGLFFLLLTSGMLILFLRARVKNVRLESKKLQLEHDNLELEQRRLKENLDFKDRELTANALSMLKSNELISQITKKLSDAKASLNQENQIIIQDIIKDLNQSQKTHIWDEFEARFTRVHSNFYAALQLQFPDLTLNEKRLCAFLRLQMTTKEISAITYQSTNSIMVARSRLRKKLNIEGDDVQLTDFLSRIEV
jgi:tetratricopeptide (TPR) repeat protein